MEKGIISKQEDHLVVAWQVELPISLDNAWHLLTTDKGLASWFPELRVGSLAEGGQLLFVMTETEQLKMPIFSYRELETIGFEWGADQVIFRLAQLSDKQTRLELEETLTAVTEHTPRDLAGWTFCLERLKKVDQGEEFEFSDVLFDEWYQYYAKELHQKD
ncbi:SRPBCC domain-containing protein [uncultured Vagococcus sp.]|uniref:SRPBCC domain-containing protein n=1 Tax=uncultured Vagococcus sp. TaxID=189676 RepID=UPI0028D6B4A6|nr:SRPBCC domain-containing protein [uncultured Vagococcus sp.]